MTIIKIMDIQSYYIIVQEAREKLKSYGMICPEISLQNIIVDKDTQEPCYSLDLNKLEENRFHHCLRELDSIIDQMLGREDSPMPKTFKVHFDENFSKDIPPCWYKKSKKENAFKNFDINGNLIEKDAYGTYTDAPATPVPQPRPEVTVESHKSDIIQPISNSSEIDNILNSYTAEKLPDTYS